MLNVLTYLRSGRSLEDLSSKLGINIVYHTSLPLAILNYDQINSPKTDKIARECRALTINYQDLSLVAKSFNRFFNWGEVAEEAPLFNWNNFTSQEKIDGSLVLFYYFDGSWQVNTRGSFANFPILNRTWQVEQFNLEKDLTWKEAITKALEINSLDDLGLDKSLTYVCEFCSPWNKVIRTYPPQVYLLTCFAGEEEVGERPTESFKSVPEYHFTSPEEITQFCNSHKDSTFEGVVVKDNLNHRWKIKNLRYLAYSRIRGQDGSALFNPSNLLPFVLQNEEDELKATLSTSQLLGQFPEVMEAYQKVKSQVANAYSEIEQLWQETWQIESQKEFALSIVGKTKFSGFLFAFRKKYGKIQNREIFCKEWRADGSRIEKVLYG
jgi:hypothetical protein